MGMRHVYRQHMRPTAPRGKSVFKSEIKGVVKNLVDETINYPNIVRRHSEPNRKIYIRDFGYIRMTEIRPGKNFRRSSWLQ